MKEEREPVIKQRRKPYGFAVAVGKYLDIGSVPVTVQNQIINHQHLPDIFRPAVSDAEGKRGFLVCAVHGEVFIQGNLPLTALSKVTGGAQPCPYGFIVDKDIRKYQLIGKVRNAKYGQQPISDDLIDRFMPDNAVIKKFLYRIERMLFYWLNRRSQRKSYTWEGFNDLLKVLPLKTPKIYVSIYGG